MANNNNLLTYVNLSWEEEHLFTAFELKERIRKLLEYITKTSIKESDNIFQILRDNQVMIEGFIEKAFLVCSKFDERNNKVELQKLAYTRYGDKTIFYKCFKIAIGKIAYQFVENSKYSIKNEQAIKQGQIKGIFAVLKDTRTKLRPKFEKEFNVSLDNITVGALFYLIQLMWDCLRFAKEIEKGAEQKSGWNLIEIFNIYTQIQAQFDKMLYDFEYSQKQIKTGMHQKQKEEFDNLYQLYKSSHLCELHENNFNSTLEYENYLIKQLEKLYEKKHGKKIKRKISTWRKKLLLDLQDRYLNEKISEKQNK